MNPGGETSLGSPLDKPLAELTEKDIAQLTREDCRRFLKERGMRRPSWNKSQAIQQVVSLKALLESDSDCPSAAGIHRKPPPPPPLPTPPAPEKKQAPYRRRDPLCRPQFAGKELLPPECPTAADIPPVGQLTIFYGGEVSVYDGVHAEKARAIMHLAASPGSEDAQPEPVPSCRPMSCRFGPSLPGPSLGPVAPNIVGRLQDNVSVGRAPRKTHSEGPTSRKALVQRYLEKRNRIKGKKVMGGSSSNMEMIYSSQKFRTQNPNEQSIHSNASSPTQPRPPQTPTRCNSIEDKERKHHRISFDLNDDGCLEP